MIIYYVYIKQAKWVVSACHGCPSVPNLYYNFWFITDPVQIPSRATRCALSGGRAKGGLGSLLRRHHAADTFEHCFVQQPYLLCRSFPHKDHHSMSPVGWTLWAGRTLLNGAQGLFILGCACCRFQAASALYHMLPPPLFF